MDYSNNSLDPEVLEFYRSNRSKNVRCRSHHHAHQHPLSRGHAQQPVQSHGVYQSGYGPVPSHHTVPASLDSSKAYRTPGTQHISSSDHLHHHIQRYRSSVSPVQTLSSSCGSSASTLASAGVCRSGSGSGPGGSSHSSQKYVTSLRAIDLIKLLREKIALLPGGRSRQGGPILCFPSNSRADEIVFEDLCMLVLYLTFLPEEQVKKLGFTVIVDMRNGTTWNSVKPILKVVEQCIGTNVAMAYIIKPDRLFEKHKANMSIGKFNYEIQLVSLETLFREVDPSQLTSELEGSLPYHHEEWIQIRCRLEEFFVSAHDMSDKFGQLFCFLERHSELRTVVEAKRALEEHRSIRLKIVQAPVSALEAEADRLITWLRYGMAAANSSSSTSASGSTGPVSSYPTNTGAGSTSSGSGGGASFLATSWVSMNPDFQQMVPLVRQTVSKLYEYRAHLQQKWETGRSRLEQIYQLRIFDEDAERMANWLGQQRHLFLTEYLDIGQTASHAADLLAEHRQFVSSCTIAFEQVARLNGVAGILADVGHFASQQILKLAAQLEHEWKSFAAALEDRSRVLCLSASFHSRAQSFLANCQHREAAMRQVTGSTVNELNQALLTLQNYFQETQSAHEEVCADGRALTDHLSAPVPTGSHTSLTAAVDYSQGRKHCTDLVHEIWAWYKRLERLHAERKARLTARLSSLMFKEDVGQVLSWLSEHGEPFLHRQTAVGKSIQRAEQLYNTHMQFEQVAAKTLTNAEKLISVADELAAQADDPEEILQKASELQRRISAFTRAVESRRETVDLGCGFYSHTKEVLAWLHGVRESHNSGEHLPATIEGMEDELTNFRRERTMIEEGADRVASEGEALIARLKDSEEVAHIRSVLAQVVNGRTVVSALLTERQVRLDLCLQLRLFEADVHSALDCLRHGVPNLTVRGSSEAGSLGTASGSGISTSFALPITGSSSSPAGATGSAGNVPTWLADPRQAPDLASLEEVSNACLTVLPTAEEVLNKGGELARAFDSVGVNFPAGGPGSSDSGVGDSVETAVERVHRLISELAEAVTAVDELNERISGELDWRRLQLQSQQVLHWIEQCEDILRETAVIPGTLAEATALQADHEKFQPVLTDAHPQAVQCAARASYLLHQAAQTSSPSTTGSSGMVSASSGSEHPHLKNYQAVAEAVASRWQSLVYAAADRHKLLLAATNWYKTSDQVTSVLWSLEKEYHREEDWCQSEKATVSGDTAAYLSQLSAKHAEQKEAFLKACMLARRTSDAFSRYLHRQPASTTGRAEVEDRMRTAMSELMAKEQAVLEAWAVRRRRLDDCIYFINIKSLVEELLDRVRNQSQQLNSPSKGLGSSFASSQLTSSLIQEVNRACESLESMIAASMPLSPGHTVQLKALLSRLQASLPSASHSSTISAAGTQITGELISGKGPQATASESTRAAVDVRKSGITSVTSRLEIPAPRGKHPYKADFDTDRTSVSSTSSSGAGSTSRSTSSTSDVFLTSPSSGPAASGGLTPEQRRMIRRRENLLRELIQTERAYIQALEHCLETYRKGLITPPKALESKIPVGLVGKVDVVFGNMQDIFEFHKQTFEPELGKYTESGDFLPEDVGHCFVVHSDRLAELYVDYCVNNTDSTQLMIDHGHGYFQALQHHLNLLEPLQSYLIKPVQRVTKYQLLLRELRDCCDPASVAELNEGLEAMLDVPKRANDALHLSMLHGLPDDLPIATLGDVILQDQFTVWEPKQLIKKSRERRAFLFDNCLILAKEAPSAAGEHKAKYFYKSRLLLAECNITEHIEGDQCKFALWTGRVPPIHEYRLVLKANTLELKQTWVRALREVMRERMFSVQSLYQHQQNLAPGKPGILSEEAELLDTYYILENYQATKDGELSVSAHQIVQVLHRCNSPHRPDSTVTVGDGDTDGQGTLSKQSAKFDPNASGEWALIRVLVHGTGSANTLQSPIKEGFIPSRLIGAPSGRPRRRQPASHTTGTNSRRPSTTVRKWLPVGDTKRTGTTHPGKRGSKADLIQPQLLTSPQTTNTSSEHATSASAASTELGAILDNVSEESIEVELPPPMSELQVLSAPVPDPEPERGDLDSNELERESSSMLLSGSIGRVRRESERSAATATGSFTHSVCEDLDNSTTSQKSSGELDQRLDRAARPPHRLAVVAEVAGDLRTTGSTSIAADGRVPTLIGLPVGANLAGLGELRLHGGLSVAAKLVAGACRTPLHHTTTSSGLDEEALRGVLDEGAELHFVNRYLFLYDQALVIADAAVELISSACDVDCSDDFRGQLQCHFRHALPISQISILEDVSVSGSKPTGDQLLWFCLSERARNLASPFDAMTANTNNSGASSASQSYLCYIVAPRSSDTRARWLTELTAMVMEARRLSQAFLATNSTVPGQSSPTQGTNSTGDRLDTNGSIIGLGISSKMSSATAAALYPSGIFFDPALLELPKIGRIQPGVHSHGSSNRVKVTVSLTSTDPITTMFESLHVTTNSAATSSS